MTKKDSTGPEIEHLKPVPDDDRDQIYVEKRPVVTDFNFGEETAAVFDDMVERSVPYYSEIQRMISEIAADFAARGTNVYDLGCATGTTLLGLDAVVDPSVRFIGVDNSAEMLEKARSKLAAAGSERPYQLVNADLHQIPIIENASMVILALTLQFVRPLQRDRLIAKVFQGLNPNGCMVLVEKITSPHTLLNRLFIKYYYDYKRRNGYSDVEIAQKREALENVLIPYRSEENQALLCEAGFRHVDEFFRWYNFSGIIAVK